MIQRIIYKVFLIQYLIKILQEGLILRIQYRLKMSQNFLFHSVGNKISPTKIANTLKSAGKSVDQKTVDKYIKGLVDSMLIYEAGRYNIKGKQFLSTQSKYYVVDVGMRNALVKSSESDIGHILENIVYLELKRRYKNVYVGEIDSGEVDFVSVNDNKYEYYQVSATTLDETH